MATPDDLRPTLKRHKSSKRIRNIDDFLDLNVHPVASDLPKNSMISLLNRNELSYEKKSLFRKKFTFGTCQTRNQDALMDKGKLLKKLEKAGTFERDWILFIYRKLNALNLHFKEKFKWTKVINLYLCKNAEKFMEERGKLISLYGQDSKKPRSQKERNTSQWKGIDTTPSNFIRFKFLKEQLKMKDHPIHQLVEQFDKWICKSYNYLRYPTLDEVDHIAKRDELIETTQQFIALLFLTTIKFYHLDFKDNENNRDILLEILTGMVIKKNLHLTISNAITYCKRDEVDILERKMNKEENVDFNKSEYIVGISDIFSFSQSKRMDRILHRKSEVPDNFNQETGFQLNETKSNAKYEK